MLSQLKTSSITKKGTELKQKVPFLCWESRSVVSVNEVEVFEELFQRKHSITNLRGTAHTRQSTACAGPTLVQGGRGTLILSGQVMRLPVPYAKVIAGF